MSYSWICTQVMLLCITIISMHLSLQVYFMQKGEISRACVSLFYVVMESAMEYQMPSLFCAKTDSW